MGGGRRRRGDGDGGRGELAAVVNLGGLGFSPFLHQPEQFGPCCRVTALF